jgi:hypothetical protein
MTERIKQITEGRCVIAKHESYFTTLLTPITPVNRIERLTPQSRNFKRHSQNMYDFYTLPCHRREDSEPENGERFDALA